MRVTLLKVELQIDKFNVVDVWRKVRMNKFDGLIDLIEPLSTDEYGEWIIDKKRKGTIDDPTQIPFPSYSDVVCELIRQVYSFEDENPDFELTNYRRLLSERGLEWGSKALEQADVSLIDAQGIMAMLMVIVRAERFCDGTILAACKSGSILRWLQRLKTLRDDNV